MATMTMKVALNMDAEILNWNSSSDNFTPVKLFVREYTGLKSKTNQNIYFKRNMAGYVPTYSLPYLKKGARLFVEANSSFAEKDGVVYENIWINQITPLASYKDSVKTAPASKAPAPKPAPVDVLDQEDPLF